MQSDDQAQPVGDMGELTKKLAELAEQQADPADPSFHKGRRLTAQDTMHWSAKAAIEQLQSNVERPTGALDDALRCAVCTPEKRAELQAALSNTTQRGDR